MQHRGVQVVNVLAPKESRKEKKKKERISLTTACLCLKKHSALVRIGALRCLSHMLRIPLAQFARSHILWLIMRSPYFSALALVLVSQIIRGAESSADLVVLNGKIVTVNPRSSIVEAAAVRDGRFVAVGGNAEIRKWIGERTRVIDAGEKTVVPGLIETHVHAIGVAQGEAVQPFIQLGSIAEIQRWVRQQLQTTPQAEWIQIPRIDLTRLREGRLPPRAPP